MSLIIFELILIGAFSKAIATSDSTDHMKSVESNPALRRADAIDYLWPPSMETVSPPNKGSSPIVRYVRNPNGFIRFGRSDSFVRFGRNDGGPMQNRNVRDKDPRGLVRIGKRGDSAAVLSEVPDNVLLWLNSYVKQHRQLEREDNDPPNSDIGSADEFYKARPQTNSYPSEFYERK